MWLFEAKPGLRCALLKAGSTTEIRLRQNTFFCLTLDLSQLCDRHKKESILSEFRIHIAAPWMTNWLAELDGSMEARVVLHYGVAIQLYKANLTKHASLPHRRSTYTGWCLVVRLPLPLQAFTRSYQLARPSPLCSWTMYEVVRPLLLLRKKSLLLLVTKSLCGVWK